MKDCKCFKLEYLLCEFLILLQQDELCNFGKYVIFKVAEAYFLVFCLLVKCASVVETNKT